MAIIDKPTDHFNTILYTGTGASLANTGVGFQPDFTWIKGRSGATEHVLTDSVRGVTKELSSNDNGAEETVAQGLTAFGTDGFTVGTDGSYNTSSATYSSWNWKKSATSGFDIVTATGTGVAKTIAHSLSAVPQVIISKEYSQANDWVMYHVSLGNNKKIILNETNAVSTDSCWNNTTPTSSVFSVSGASVVNRNSSTYVYYLFANTSMIKAGSYVGNGNADGTFIYTGFKPAFVLMKGTNVNGWLIIDNKRTAYNSDSKFLYPQASDAEDALSGRFDFTSNGFKLRNTWTAFNSSGQTYIYMAFAENPFVTSTDNGSIPATAR
jgi:hypothetical protein